MSTTVTYHRYVPRRGDTLRFVTIERNDGLTARSEDPDLVVRCLEAMAGRDVEIDEQPLVTGALTAISRTWSLTMDDHDELVVDVIADDPDAYVVRS